MHAIVVREGGGPEVLELDEVPDPEPGEGQVLVRVEAAAVNHFDLTQRRDPAAVGTALPYTPGVDAAGTRADTGQRVLVTGAPGTYAALVAAPLENVWPIPESLDSAHAAALGVTYKTAWASLRDGEVRRGDTLLVQAGSSGTGQAAIDTSVATSGPPSTQPRASRSTTASAPWAPSRSPTTMNASISSARNTALLASE